MSDPLDMASEEEVELMHITELGYSLKPTDSDDSTVPKKDTQAKEKYDMLGTVGSGAMGEILLARDQELRRKVAYKKIHSTMTSNRKVMDRFFTEAQITAQLDHPNIVPIYSLEISAQGNIGYSMKLIQGKTFKELMREARQQYDEKGQVDEEHSLLALLDHFLKVCDAMFYSHNKGVIHRDLKPANIMVGRYNEVYVMDWGIAKVITHKEAVIDDEVALLIHSDTDEPPMERTQLGQVVGTPRYMSPQQAAGKNNLLDASCDQFALGLILFELISLGPAFRAKNQIDLLKKVLKAELEPFVHYYPKVRIPIELQAIVNKATALKTDKRYASVSDLADDIRRFLRGEAVHAKPDTSLQKVLRWMGQHRQFTLVLVLGIFVLSSSTVIWSLYQQQQAMIRAQIHEKKLSGFLMNVAKRAQLIDSQFTNIEAGLESLSSVAVHLLEFGQPSSDPLFTHLDFYNPFKSPPDLRYSALYKAQVSTDWTSFKISPGVNQTDIEPFMRKLSPLRHTFRHIALQSHSNKTTKYQGETVRKLLTEKGVPLIWAYVGIKQGLLINYPGNTGYKLEYDARKRPWYTHSLQQVGTRWQSPYIDASGTGWVLPCTLPLYNTKGEFLGVAGVEMTLEFIKSQYLKIKDLPGILNSYILDEQGRIVASTQEKSEKFTIGTLVEKTRDLVPYSRSEVVSQLLKNRSGYFEDSKGQVKQVLAYYPINSLGWYYLVEANTKLLNID